ncbi:MAG: hypothetical protein K2R98_24625 [Gemmataceae bacterium]|nr:hypothetical protein [Gemmataceae bacterium]
MTRSSGAIFSVDPAQGAVLARQLLTTCDKDKNGKLSREEIGLDKKAFDKLDADQDGELNADELTKFASLTPDGEYIVRLGTLGDREAATDVINADGPLAPMTKKVNDGLALSLGNAQIDLSRGDGATINSLFNRQTFLQQFRFIAGEKGMIEKKDVQGGNGRFLAGLFPLADRDGDGKLTEKELNEFLDMQAKIGVSQAVLTIADQGRGLFDALDANRDGRLSFHELRSAWDRVKSWDRDGRGFITRDDIPTQLQLKVSHGPPNVGNLGNSRGPFTNPVTAPTKGPMWFRKMDRNADGVVSAREWLGTAEEFKRVDTNGDGSIDLDEAERYDAATRPGTK